MDTPDNFSDDGGQPWWRKRLRWLLAALLALPAILKRLLARSPEKGPPDSQEPQQPPELDCPPSAREQRRRAELAMVLEHEAPLYYVAGLVAGPAGERVDDDRLELLSADALSKVLACLGPDRSDEPQDVSALAEVVSVYRIDARLDPLTISQQLEGRVAPVHVMAPAVHWSFEPGEDAKPFFSFLSSAAGVARRPTSAAATATASVRRIAVVDTGVVETKIPEIDGWIDAGPGDVDTDGRGHGTFIASVIRQVAPTHRIAVARAASISRDEILRAHPPGEDEDLPPDVSFTSELGVADAIVRLIQRHENDAIDALVLSLGTWADQLTEASALRLALERWFASGPGKESTVFAAAGNEKIERHGAEEPELRFFPAALAQNPYERLRAVQPTLHSGEPVYWVPGDPERRVFEGHKWATDWVLGVDLLGACGASAQRCVGAEAVNAGGEVARFVSWSGASFATPVVAAATVAASAAPKESQVQFDGGDPRTVNVWSYDEIPGLSYLPGP